MAADDQNVQEVLQLLEKARIKADAFIVVGILPDRRICYSVDERITIPDLHGELQANVDFICASVARYRAQRAKTKAMNER